MKMPDVSKSCRRLPRIILFACSAVLILGVPWTVSADLQVVATINPQVGDECNRVEEAIRAIVDIEGGAIHFVDYESRRIVFRIDESSWPLVQRLTLDPMIYNQCVGWSPPCSTAPIRMYATVTSSGKDDFVAALTEVGGRVRDEFASAQGVTFRFGVPGDGIQSLVGRPEVLDLELEGFSTGTGQPDLTLYLGEGFPFRVTAEWETEDAFGRANPMPLTRDTGAFSFFRPDNLELTVKILDGCALTGHYWVFAAGLTNVGVTLEVTTNTATKTYTNPVGQTFETITDTRALPCG